MSPSKHIFNTTAKNLIEAGFTSSEALMLLKLAEVSIYSEDTFRISQRTLALELGWSKGRVTCNTISLAKRGLGRSTGIGNALSPDEYSISSIKRMISKYSKDTPYHVLRKALKDYKAFYVENNKGMQENNGYRVPLTVFDPNFKKLDLYTYLYAFDKKTHIRTTDMADATGFGIRAIQKRVKKLVSCGILVQKNSGREVYYDFNKEIDDDTFDDTRNETEKYRQYCREYFDMERVKWVALHVKAIIEDKADLYGDSSGANRNLKGLDPAKVQLKHDDFYGGGYRSRRYEVWFDGLCYGAYTFSLNKIKYKSDPTNLKFDQRRRHLRKLSIRNFKPVLMLG